MIFGSSAFSFSLSYEELLLAAQRRDSETSLLKISEERAELAYRGAVAGRDGLRVEATTGQVSALWDSAGGALVSAAPEASVSIPRSLSLSARTNLEYGPDGASATPGLGASIPVVRGRDDTILAAEEAKASWSAASRKRWTRAISVELSLAKALKAVADAESTLQTARRDEAKAATEVDRAVKIDGASPGGTSLLGLERKLRQARATRRKAESVRAQAVEGVESLCGISPLAEVITLDAPAADLTISLPPPEKLSEVLEARGAEDRAALKRSESRRRTTLSATVDATGRTLGSSTLGSYFLEGPASDASATETPASLLGGLSLERGGAKVSAAAGWQFGADGGPRVNFRFDWKVQPWGQAARDAQDSDLEVRASQIQAEAALEAAREKLRRLEQDREDLSRTETNLREDLRTAEEELRLYQTWRDRGIVGASDLEEVAAATEQARAELRSSAFDRLIWTLEARLLASGGAETPEGSDQ